MDPLTIAILTALGKVGIDAVIAFLENRGTTLDDAIAALKIAREKDLAAYIAEDAARRLKELQPPAPDGAVPLA